VKMGSHFGDQMGKVGTLNKRRHISWVVIKLSVDLKNKLGSQTKSHQKMDKAPMSIHGKSRRWGYETRRWAEYVNREKRSDNCYRMIWVRTR